MAFIYAYTRVLGRPPAEADMQRHFRVSPLRFTKWCSPSNERGWFDDSLESLAASKCWLLPSCSRSYVDSISTDQNGCETCRRLNIPIRDYLGSVLPGLADRPISQTTELTPAAWANRK